MNKSEELQRRILNTIGDLLTDICEESTQTKDTNDPNIIKPFISKKIPGISISKYLSRLLKYSKMENSTLVLILIYIDRVCDINKIRLNYYNIHKLILSAMMIALKYNEDDYFTNEFYAKVGGVTKKEIDKLEYEFLIRTEYKLFVSKEVFEKYNNYLITAHEEEEDEDSMNDTNNNTNIEEENLHAI